MAEFFNLFLCALLLTSGVVQTGGTASPKLFHDPAITIGISEY
jgi:hypothetical protein